MNGRFSCYFGNALRTAFLGAGFVLTFVAPAISAPSVPVTVTNTPSVAVVSMPTVNSTIAGSVDAQGSARSAVSTFCDVPIIDQSSGNSSCLLISVPAGKILVIESMLCFAHIPADKIFGSILLIAAAPNPTYPAAGNLSTINHFLTMTPLPNADYGGNHSYGLTTPIKLYAFGPAAGTGGTIPVYVNVQIGQYTLGPANPTFGCTMAGVLENQ